MFTYISNYKCSYVGSFGYTYIYIYRDIYVSSHVYPLVCMKLCEYIRLRARACTRACVCALSYRCASIFLYHRMLLTSSMRKFLQNFLTFQYALRLRLTSLKRGRTKLFVLFWS